MLDILMSAALLTTRDGSASSGSMLSGASLVAPMHLEDRAQQLARCSLDLAAGAAQLSGPDSGSICAGRYAVASIQRHGSVMQLQAAAVDRCRTGASAYAVQAQNAMRPVLRQRLAQAVPGTRCDGTMLPVAPLDCTLQLSAIPCRGHRDSSRSPTVLVPSGLQACKAPSYAMLPGPESSAQYWAFAAPGSPQDSSSHRLTAAHDEVVGAAALEGVLFKPSSLGASAAGCPHPAARAAHDATQILYELCPVVVSPASIAAAGAVFALQARLQLRSCRPASAAAAALMALQALASSDAAQRTAGRQAMLLEGGDQGVDALLRTARLEQPSLDASLTGTTICDAHCRTSRGNVRQHAAYQLKSLR